MATTKFTFDIVSESPIAFGKPIASVKRSKETHSEFEERTWKERAHVDENNELFISPLALKNCLSEVAQYLGEKVPGKGMAKYTKHFQAGVTVIDPMKLGVKLKDVKPYEMFVPADGRRGGTTRVWKKFPHVTEWRSKGVVHVSDETITADKLEEYLTQAGLFIGMGSFRPRNNGYFGRFRVENFKAAK